MNEQLILKDKVGQLKRTIDETTLGHQSINGIKHVELYDRTIDILDKRGYKPVIEPIWVSEAGSRKLPGISLIPRYEQDFGEKAIEAHIIRRLLGRLIMNAEDDTTTNMNIALAYHQDGYQIAIGANVKICSNLCIFGGFLLSSYGPHKIDNGNIFKVLDNHIEKFEQVRKYNQELLQRMIDTPINEEYIIDFTGRMEQMAVKQAYLKGGTAPLNIGQVSTFTRNVLMAMEEDNMKNLYHLYNAGTALHKVDSNDIVTLLPANNTMSNFMLSRNKEVFEDIIKKYPAFNN